MTQSELILESIRKYLVEFLISKGIPNPVISFEKPEIESHGDFATNIALRYAKILKNNPIDLAGEISDFLKNKKMSGISKVEAVAPGYVNIFFDTNFTVLVLNDILKLADSFGENKLLEKQKWVVEHTSPNPNKAMHIGHLRNNLIGMSITHLLEWSGASVVCDAVDNDRGIAIAKLMWGFLTHMKKDKKTTTDIGSWIANPSAWYTPEDLNLLPDLFVSKCYLLGADDFKNPDIEKKIRDLVVQWEKNDANVWKLWKYVLSYSYQGINRTLNRLGNRWDKVWHEHEHYKEGKKYVEKGLKKGIFKKLEDGAVLTNLSEYNLPDTILLKSDGTTLYITQDIALTALKKKTYHANKLVWVIGSEQSIAMKQVFAICEQLGIGSLDDFTHISYGYVGLKDADGNFKKMSSREGTVVLIDDIINAVRDKILQEFLKDKKDINTEEIAEKLALAAVKFNILKSDRNQDIAFDIERSIEMQGDTGVYILYTYARSNSILRKAYKNKALISPQAINSAEELTKNLALFPEIVKRSLSDLSVHHIAQYLLTICAIFNGWYAKEIILDGSASQPHKLAVTKSVNQVIKNGLSILGIETLDEI